MQSLNPQGIERFCQALEQACGLNYPPSKSYLFDARLGAIVAQHGCRNYDDLTYKLRHDMAARQAIISALVTSETYFFRDEETFRALPAIAKRYAVSAHQPLIIWSLGCATGQEAYSILMALDEAGQIPLQHVKLIGADISPEVIQRARAGVYTTFETQRGLSPERRSRYMQAEGDSWRVSSALREATSWMELNLLEGVLGLPRPHLVFCRNILIYFSDANKAAVMGNIVSRLNDQGVVILGNTENALPYQSVCEVHSQDGILHLTRPAPGLKR